MDDLTLEIADGIATVTLNRPAKKNALSEALFKALPDMAARIAEMPEVRVVVLTGAGDDFCAGIDLQFLQSLLPRMDEIQQEMKSAAQGANFFQRPVTAWQDLGLPVIAAIQGVCLGGGLQLALGADIRLAAPSAKLSIMEAKWGLIPDMGITQSLPKLMRADQAKELMMTARVVDAQTASALGLVTRVCEDPLRAAYDLASEISTRSPQAVAGAKALVDRTWALPVSEGLAVEGELQSQLIGTPNQLEAVMSGMTKRAPNFR